MNKSRHVEPKDNAELSVSVTFRHVDSSPAIRDYATDKVQRVTSKYLRRAEDAHIILSVAKRRHMAEINIRAAHFDISAHATTEDLYSATDAAVDKVEAQLRKHKDRINHHKGHQSTAGAASEIDVKIVGIDGPAGGGAPRVIETEKVPAKPLSLDDAILQLELQHASFLVFRNASDESISVIYKRSDGNYGLIAPNT